MMAKRRRGKPSKGYTRRKRFRSRKRRGRRPVMNAARPLPSNKVLKFRYVTTAVINPPITGGVAAHVFRANGMFDPDFTGTGHQPLGFDQWVGAFYNHWVVIGAKITATFVSPQNGVSTGTLIGGVELKDDSIVITADANGKMELPNAKYTFITSADSGKPLSSISQFFSARKFFRLKDVIGDSTQRGTVAADPSEQAFFHVWCGAQDVTTDITNVSVTVVIDYIAAMLEPNELSPS